MRHIFTVAILLSACSCGGPENTGWEPIWEEVRDLPVGRVFWLWMSRVLLFAFLGALASLAAFSILKRYGAYRVAGKARPWLLTLIAIFMLGLGVAIGAFIGNLRAAGSIAEAAIQETAIGKKTLPTVGNIAADIVALAEQVLVKKQGIDWELEAFEVGDAPVDVRGLLDHVEGLKEFASGELAAKAIDHFFEQNPDWKGGRTEQLARGITPIVAERLVDRKVRDKLTEFGVPDFLDQLSARARQHPDGKMTRLELGKFFADDVIYPALMKPIHAHLRMAEILLLLGGVAGAFLPIGLIEIARWLLPGVMVCQPKTGSLPPD